MHRYTLNRFRTINLTRMLRWLEAHTVILPFRSTRVHTVIDAIRVKVRVRIRVRVGLLCVNRCIWNRYTSHSFLVRLKSESSDLGGAFRQLTLEALPTHSLVTLPTHPRTPDP